MKHCAFRHVFANEHEATAALESARAAREPNRDLQDAPAIPGPERELASLCADWATPGMVVGCLDVQRQMVGTGVGVKERPEMPVARVVQKGGEGEQQAVNERGPEAFNEKGRAAGHVGEVEAGHTGRDLDFSGLDVPVSRFQIPAPSHASESLAAKRERVKVFCEWLLDTFGSDELRQRGVILCLWAREFVDLRAVLGAQRE